MRQYSFKQRVINESNKLSNDCVYGSSVNMFQTEMDRKNCWTFEKSMASLSTCYLELAVLDGNLVKFCHFCALSSIKVRHNSGIKKSVSF